MQVQRKSRDGYEEISKRLAEAKRREPLLSAEWLASIKTARMAAREALGASAQNRKLLKPFDRIFDQLEDAGKAVRRLQSGVKRSGESLSGLSGEVRAFSRVIGEMAVLEEKMKSISSAGRDLIDRLVETDEEEEGQSQTPP